MMLAKKGERSRLYDLANDWLRIARNSASRGDHQGERIALDYVMEIIAELKEGTDAD